MDFVQIRDPQALYPTELLAMNITRLMDDICSNETSCSTLNLPTLNAPFQPTPALLMYDISNLASGCTARPTPNESSALEMGFFCCHGSTTAKHFITQIYPSSGLMDGVLGSWLAVHGFYPWIGHSLLLFDVGF